MSSQWKSIMLILLVLLGAMSASLAQDTVSRELTSSIPVSGTLDTTNLVQVYTFSGVSGQIVGLSATTSDPVRLVLALTDSAGLSLAQASATEAGGGVVLDDVPLNADGTYYVSVLSGDGVLEQAATFELTLVQSIATGIEFTLPGQYLTTTGLQIELAWNSTANLDLEVRDPVGGSLFWDRPGVTSGGSFGVNVNAACETVTADNPTERVSWPSGVIPTGSYELLVYYQPVPNCPTNDPVTFTISAIVDGQAVAPVEGTLQPNQVFITSFRVATDGNLTSGLNGIKIDPPVAPNIGGAETISLPVGVPASSAITDEQVFNVYTFSGQAGEVITLDMSATSGSLDTLLFLLGPDGATLISNDDRERGITNAAIANYRLLVDGTYTVIATRYGQAIGGTEGNYSLTLTGATAAVLPVGADLTAVPGLADLPVGSVEVSLQWSTNADLQLLVRDPQGDAVYDDSPSIASGGTLGANGNVNCVPAVSGSPLSYIYWPEGRLPTAGPYEIEVQFQSECGDTTPVTFVLSVVANGELITTNSQQIRLGQRYVGSFNIDLNNAVTAGESGIFGTVQRPDSTTFGDLSGEFAGAVTMTSNQTVTGGIRLERKYVLYGFDGEAGQRVSVSMEALSGTLDPVLFLIDPNGVQVAQNDDASRDTTNSLINEFTLSESGRYIIIATHFGGRYGVTAGDYRLTLRLN